MISSCNMRILENPQSKVKSIPSMIFTKANWPNNRTIWPLQKTFLARASLFASFIIFFGR
ncbi:hypothetical protein NC653_008482 [Populus alba x Populus x berolinensis]|uniref:Uncharacterized protein n=1 Tax=Populus alba x Populus x berolinensis TaxID=444605 RepID=A0AAD6R6T9_9ROSI|nr:hypothetical protein NC653_008482 [Populus alba x Populus x berolinensis]